MIEVLNGIKETVLYKDIEGFKLHDNTDYESYPEHWHTPIEIIMPIENFFDVSNKKEIFTLQEDEILFINSGVIHGMPSTIHGERLILQVDLALLHSVADIASMLSTIPQALLLTPANAPHHPRTAQGTDVRYLPGILQRFHPDQRFYLL